MKWKKIEILTHEAAADLVASVLIEAGAGGVEITGGSVPEAGSDEYRPELPDTEEVKVGAYFGEDGFNGVQEWIENRIASLVKTAETDMGPLRVSVETVADTDWNENFKKNFTAFRAAGNIIVKPTWESYEQEDGDIVIEMDPGMAFGSGTHETTRMCLSLIQKYLTPGAQVADVGCGSGILGIACAKLGAASVLALDNDPVSVAVATENAQRNGTQSFAAVRSDLLRGAGNQTFDLVLANIIADAVIRLSGSVADHLKSGGVFIASGIIEERLPDVLSSLEENGMAAQETKSLGEWKAVAARRKEETDRKPH